MNWLDIRTGYSFKAVFGHMDEIINHLKANKCTIAGIADLGGTFGHVRWKKACEGAGIRPAYGVRLFVSDEHPVGTRKYYFKRCEMTFVATTNQGLQEIYHLVDLAHQNFYQIPKITYDQLNATSNEVIVYSGVAPELDKVTRPLLMQISPDLPHIQAAAFKGKYVAAIDNWYPTQKDNIAYETFAAGQYIIERKTTPMWIPTDDEWFDHLPPAALEIGHEALNTRNVLAGLAAKVELPQAPFISVGEDSDQVLKRKCKQAMKRKKPKGPAKKRLKRELKLIIEKGFSDYFLVVADLVQYAKKHMVVGPARGSAAGSLVCYLLDITTINPLEYDLLFERFIDINRTDLPDIDIDFQDDKRHLVIEYLQHLYGNECVAQIGNVSNLKPKSAINRTAKALWIPSHQVEEFKNGVEERPEGDARARYAITDAFKTELGKGTLEIAPTLKTAARLEGHPSHSSVHAAGVLVCTQHIGKFCGINSREKGKRIAMIDKRDAEELNLLKIDALGLKTLSTLAEVCDQLGKPYSWLEKIPLNDEATYKLINRGDLMGIFQMEGTAMLQLAKDFTATNIEDLAALSALCRPGPLMAGTAGSYVKHSNEKGFTGKYICDHPAFLYWTQATQGYIIYQEQIMGICKDLGQLPWPDVIKIRKLMGKSMGDEAFNAYRKAFVKGAKANGVKKKTAVEVWTAMENFGKYGFNKSHAVAYAIISYLTAYMKAHHPLEFTVGMLNHSNNVRNGLKVLRAVVESGHKYVPVDLDHSQPGWSVHDGKILGGLTAIDGVGPANAKTIMKCRREGAQLPAGLQKKLTAPTGPFVELYPGEAIYGDYYHKGKKKSRATPLAQVTEDKQEYIAIGCLIYKAIKNINDQKAVNRRSGNVKDGPEMYWSFEFEDDTGSIVATISRFTLNRLKEEGRDPSEMLANDAQEGKDWFRFKGQFTGEEFNRMFIDEIEKITVEPENG